MKRDWLEGLDIDLGLIEVRDDVDAPWERRALAGASVGMDPEEALIQAHELASAIDLMVAGNPLGKPALAGILGDPGNDYQRCLWYTVAGRHPLAIASEVRHLVDLLRTREEQWREAGRTGRSAVKAPSPYMNDEADGPLGEYPKDFELGAQWQGIAEGV